MINFGQGKPMTLESLIDWIYGNIFWFALVLLIIIILYTVYSSLEKG